MTSSAFAQMWSGTGIAAAALGCAAMLACSDGPGVAEDGTTPLSAPALDGRARPLGTARDPNGPHVPVDPPEVLIPPVAIDPTNIPGLIGPGTLYISTRSAAGALMWDVASQNLVGGIGGPGQSGASHVTTSHDLKNVYMTASQAGTVTKIDTLTRSKVAMKTIAGSVGSVIVSGDGATVFTYDSTGHLYSTPSTLTGPVTTEVVPGNPNLAGMAWSADGKRLFVGSGLSTNVYVRQSAAPGAFATLLLPAGSGTNGISGLATMPSLGLVFAPNYGADTVTAFAGNGTVYANAGSTVPSGDLPIAAVPHPSRPYVYVTNPRLDQLTILKVVMVNGQPQLSVASTIANICNSPNGVAFSRSQARAFVVCDGAVVTLDSSTDTVILSRQAPPLLNEVVWAY